MALISNVNTFLWSNAVKFDTLCLRKGNWYIGVNDVGKGPTVGTATSGTYWNGFNQTGGTDYVTYVYKVNQGPSIRYPKTGADLITYTNQLPGASSFTTVEECFAFFYSNDDYVLLNGDIPAVITNGASLYLEPRNVICNPRNDVWLDLTQKLIFNAVHGQLVVTNFNGYAGFAFDGTGSWNYSTDPSLVDFGGDCTLIMWLYSNVSSRDATSTLFQKDGTSYLASQQEIEVVWNVDTSIDWFSRYSPGTDQGTIPPLSNVGWVMVAIKMSTGKTATPRTGYYSINGGSWTSSYTSNSNVAVVAAGAVNIGVGDNGNVSQGGLGMVMAYNRMLSDAEIYRIFGASRGLYGI